MKTLNLMNFTLNIVFLSIVNTAYSFAQTQTYEVPPSDKTSLSVPYISDAAMEQCVVLWNKAKWLSEEIESTQVDQYSQTSVDAYNKKINRHASMIDAFNRNCAGKQSESAYKAAKELNERSGGVE